MITEQLKSDYKNVLSKITSDLQWTVEDKFSGVFLPVPFDEYEQASKKILFVGRETAGWNTKTGKNTMQYIVKANEKNELGTLIEDAVDRYRWHLLDKKGGKQRTKERSHLKRYYRKVAKELDLPPEGMIYSNLLSWDYNKKGPLQKLPKEDKEKVIKLSNELLAIQIKTFEPDYIIFASGVSTDGVIKRLFKEHFREHKTIHVNPRKLWEFEAAGAKCFRIAHPNTRGQHAEFQQEVIDRIRSYQS